MGNAMAYEDETFDKPTRVEKELKAFEDEIKQSREDSASLDGQFDVSFNEEGVEAFKE